MNLSPHFTLEEMIKSQAGDRAGIDNMPSPLHREKLRALCTKVLEPIRERFGPVIITSGYRGPELNRMVGGASSSQHCLGEAADIEVPGMSNGDLARWIEKHLEYDQLILECYKPGIPDSGWVHVSYRAFVPNRKEELTATVVNGKMHYTPGIAK
jgi:zinc D-Ala-D-Ala carboxypeptidase